MANTLRFCLFTVVLGLAVSIGISWLYRLNALQALQNSQEQTVLTIGQVLSQQIGPLLPGAMATTAEREATVDRLQQQFQGLGLGLEILDLTGRPMVSTTQPSLRPYRPTPESLALARSGVTASLILQSLQQDDRPMPVILSLAPIKTTERADTAAVLLSFNDISERLAAIERNQWQLTALILAAFLPVFIYFLTNLRRSHSAVIAEKNSREQENRNSRRKTGHDPLTGLPNRSLLQERMQMSLAQAKRHNSTFVIMFLDLDGFKAINDTLGHQVGDLLLQAISKRLVECVREGDTVARLGGDEFVVLLPLFDNRYQEQEADVASRILKNLSRPISLKNQQLQVGCSIGISHYPRDASSVETLLKNADEAMYRAKADGRNTFKFYASKPGLTASQPSGLREDLKRALQQQEFQVMYQPRINLKRGRIAGATASLHWQHSNFGLVTAARFFPSDGKAAVATIGEWLLKSACQQCRNWQRQGLDTGPVTIDVDCNLFRLQTLDQTVSKALASSGLEPSLLALNLGAHLLSLDPENIRSLLDRLRQLGVRLAIDGSCYSPSLVSQLPLNCINISADHIAGITSSDTDVGIAKALIVLAGSQSAETCANGVESKAQLLLLRKLGCDQVQGDNFRPPLIAADFARQVSAQMKNADLAPTA